MKKYVLLPASGVVIAVAVCSVFGQPNPPTTEERVKVRDQFWQAAATAEAEGKLDRALEAARQALAIDRELFPGGRPELVIALENVARLHELNGGWDDARKLRKEVIAIREKSSGPDHWQTRDARNALAFTETLAGLTPENLRLIWEADRLHLEGIARIKEKPIPLATELIRKATLFHKAMEYREKALGSDHLETASSAAMLGMHLSLLGGKEPALTHLQKALVVYRKGAGDVHPSTVMVMQIMAEVYANHNEPAKAVALYQEVLSSRGKLYGLNDTEQPEILRRLAVSARAAKDYRTAADAQERLLSLHQLDRTPPNDFWDRVEELGAAYKEELDAARQTTPGAAAPLVEVAERQAAFYQRLIAAACSRRDYASASRIESAVLDLWIGVHGHKHWRVRDALINRARFDRLAKMPRSRQDLIEEAERKEDWIPMHFSPSSGGATAFSMAQTYLQYRKDILGRTDPEYARSLDTLGVLHQKTGNLEKARDYFTQAWEVRRQTLGEDHPQVAISLNNLGQLHHEAGEYPQALVCLKQALAILDKQLDHRHPAYRAVLNNLGVVHQRLGDHARAVELLGEAYDAFLKDTRDSEEIRYRRYAGLKGLTLDLTSDLNWSGNLYVQLHSGTSPVIGQNDIDQKEKARLLNNLARADMTANNLLTAVHRLTESKEIYEELAAEFKEGLYSREDHARCLNNLALAHILRKEFDQARPLLDRSLELRKKAYGDARPEYATGLTSLAFLHVRQGRLDDARPLLQRAAEILKLHPGEESVAYADVLGNLALIDATQRRHADALRALEVALRISADQLRSSAAVQSERQQLAMLHQLRGHLDAFLGVALKAKHDPDATYAPVLTWKGSVFARQRRLRERRFLSGAGQGEAARLLIALEDVTRQLGRVAQAQADSPSPDGRKELAALERQKEELEQQLAAASPEVRSRQEIEAMTPAGIRSALPRNAVLVDYLEYAPPTIDPSAKRERRLAAFVVRHEGPVIALDLGLADPVAEAVDRWRQTTERRYPVRDESDPAVELRRRVWEPIAEHLGDAGIILVSPDGALGKLPFAALPGKNRDTYLIEEITLVTIPVPQELPRLVAALGRKRSDDEPTMLVVGDVDFDAGNNGSDHAPGQWKKLPGTRGEMLAVRDTFEQKYPFPDGQVHALRGARATEALFRDQAPRHRWLHLATHGFFAPQASGITDTARGQSTAMVDGRSGFHPGVLSGLVMAGANCPPRAGGDDGILTALEIAELNLNDVDVAVLSACETGLGTAAGGEGLIGLQRAFQTAGVRTVVASLWPVDDAATRQLMERFYENLWSKGKSPAQALRQAQLAMLREELARGMIFRDETTPDPTRPARVPPKYWAAFTLGGAW